MVMWQQIQLFCKRLAQKTNGTRPLGEKEEEMEKYEFKIKTNANDLFEFMMVHNYKCLRGVLSVAFSLAALIGMIAFWGQTSSVQKICLGIFALMFTVITPIEYKIRAKRQEKKTFETEYTYIFDESGIVVKANELSNELSWDEVYKVISTKNLVVIYFSPVRAFILPKKTIGNNFAEFKKLMEKKTNCYRFKMEE